MCQHTPQRPFQEAPRPPREAPSTPPEALRSPQEAPRPSQEAQDRPKTVQDRPKRLQDRPKKLPRPPSSPKNAPRGEALRGHISPPRNLLPKYSRSHLIHGATMYLNILEVLKKPPKRSKNFPRRTYWSLRASYPPCLKTSKCLPPSASAGFAKRKQLILHRCGAKMHPKSVFHFCR